LLPNLIKRGFPEPHRDTGMFDLDAIALGGGAAAPTPARWATSRSAWAPVEAEQDIMRAFSRIRDRQDKA